MEQYLNSLDKLIRDMEKSQCVLTVDQFAQLIERRTWLLAPAYHLQYALRMQFLGNNYWERLSAARRARLQMQSSDCSTSASAISMNNPAPSVTNADDDGDGCQINSTTNHINNSRNDEENGFPIPREWLYQSRTITALLGPPPPLPPASLTAHSLRIQNSLYKAPAKFGDQYLASSSAMSVPSKAQPLQNGRSLVTC